MIRLVTRTGIFVTTCSATAFCFAIDSLQASQPEKSALVEKKGAGHVSIGVKPINIEGKCGEGKCGSDKLGAKQDAAWINSEKGYVEPACKQKDPPLWCKKDPWETGDLPISLKDEK